MYQANSLDQPRRVVAKLDWHRRELLPRGRFIITNLNLPSEGVVHFYNGRGTAKQWIKETEYALKWTRLSCHRFATNHWSLRRLQVKLIKIGGRLVRHTSRLVFQLT